MHSPREVLEENYIEVEGNKLYKGQGVRTLEENRD